MAEEFEKVFFEKKEIEKKVIEIFEKLKLVEGTKDFGADKVAVQERLLNESSIKLIQRNLEIERKDKLVAQKSIEVESLSEKISQLESYQQFVKEQVIL